MGDFAYKHSEMPDSIDIPEEELLPRLPRSLPFDALVFIIEDRLTGLVQLPYTMDQIHGSVFYLQVIRPIVASLILPSEKAVDESMQDPSSKEDNMSAAASIRASHSNKPTTPSPVPQKPYSFYDQHRGIVAALLVARLEFLDSASEGGTFGQALNSTTEDMMFRERGVLEARAYTAELVALKFLSFMTLETDRIEFLTYEYNIEQDGVDTGDDRMTPDLSSSTELPNTEQSGDPRAQFPASSGRSMVHLPLRRSSTSQSRTNLFSRSRATSPKGRQPVPISKSSQNFLQLGNSGDDKSRGMLFPSAGSYDNKFRSRPSSISDTSPLLGSSPVRSYENPFTEELLSAATNPSTNTPPVEPSSPQGWGDSPHDRLIEHGLFIEQYADQSALDLALVGSHPAREFISSDAVQRVMAGIWSGRIMYWKTIEKNAKKTIHLYNPRNPVDWYSRLRVPRYRSFFMMINYSVLITLFYVLLFRRHHAGSAAVVEFFLNVWFAGFVLDELSQVREAGSFEQYIADFWSYFDLCIVGIFMTYACFRVLGFFLDNEAYTSLSFDILSLEAVLLVPRLFSFLFIFPYFGTLLPCLRDLTVEFFKFLVIIAIIYVGFLTTFSFLGRQTFSFEKMSWLLIRVFFGSSYAGFDAAPEISPAFGPPLMLIFITLTNILLVTVLISILSQRFSIIMLNARQEYALLFSAIVIESVNTSNRVTYFYPPINILGPILRLLRVFMTSGQYRSLRIHVLKATHWPFVALVYAFEHATLGVHRRRVKKYMKIRKDRRLSVAQRVVFQRELESFTDFEDDEDDSNSSDNPNSDLEDLNFEVFRPSRRSRTFAGSRSSGLPQSSVLSKEERKLKKRSKWKIPSETFFPRFKKFPKRIKKPDT